MSNQWFRVWHGMPTDPKLRGIARRSGQPLVEVLSVWLFVLDHASQADERGTIVGWSDDDVAAALDIEAESVAAIREAMQGKLLDDDEVRSWEKRQPKREDGSAERAKAWRERNRTQPNAEKRPDTDTDTDKKEVGVCETRVRAAQGLEVSEGKISHPAFSIDIAAIHLLVVGTGKGREEVARLCEGHARQWAAEIDGGKPPRDVLPQKIANFLASSVTSAHNVAAVQGIRERRAAESPPRNGKPPAPAGKPSVLAFLSRTEGVPA